MDDKNIIDLYFKRDEKAIKETKNKYENYLYTIAYQILFDREDSEECLNDTYLSAWNSMPPERPRILKLFLGGINRNHAIDIYRKKSSQKRGGSIYKISLEELGQVASTEGNPVDEVEFKALVKALNDFLNSKDELNRDIFICRYYFFDPIKNISRFFNLKENAVKARLYRMREELKEFLIKEGFEL